jgi:predicted GTPase
LGGRCRKGVTPLDEELARLLRETGKRVMVAANKVDATQLEDEASDFSSLRIRRCVSNFRRTWKWDRRRARCVG